MNDRSIAGPIHWAETIKNIFGKQRARAPALELTDRARLLPLTGVLRTTSIASSFWIWMIVIALTAAIDVGPPAEHVERGDEASISALDVMDGGFYACVENGLKRTTQAAVLRDGFAATGTITTIARPTVSRQRCHLPVTLAGRYSRPALTGMIELRV